MNEDALNDPVLQSLEASLASAAPQLSADEQHRLLYACAFKAGQQAAVRSTRRWQAAAASLALVIFGLVIPRSNQPPNVARVAPVNNEPQQTSVKLAVPVAIIEDSIPRPDDSWSTVQRPSKIRLDAWKRTPSTIRSDSPTLAQHGASTASRDGLTVGGLNCGSIE